MSMTHEDLEGIGQHPNEVHVRYLFSPRAILPLSFVLFVSRSVVLYMFFAFSGRWKIPGGATKCHRRMIVQLWCGRGVLAVMEVREGGTDQGGSR